MSVLALFGGDRSVTAEHPRAWPVLSPRARAAAAELLDQGELSDYNQGPVITAFDEVVRDYHGVPHVLGASSGTAALHMAFHGVGVGPGDEVIVPSYSFHATVAPLFLLGAVPVLCDVDPLTGNIDVADAAARVTERTKAIAVTHMWGHPADLTALAELADRHAIKIVEDGSHAHGARYRGRLVGTFGDVAAFSLGARKMVSGGTAGVLVTKDERVLRAALPVGHSHERASLTLPLADVAVGIGGNYHIGTLPAAIATDQYRSLDERIATKAAVLQGLSRRLAGIPGVRPQFTAGHVTRGGWYGYKARYVPEELDGVSLDRFAEALRAEGLLVDRPSNRPLHWLDMFASRRLEPAFYRPGRPRPLYRRGELPGAERYYESSLSFPAVRLHEPCDDLLDQYAEGILKVVKNIDRLR